MSAPEEMNISIQQYKAQLSQVEAALKQTVNDAERKSLESLKSDLQELLDLTKETLHQYECNVGSGNSTGEASNQSSDNVSYDDEMALFMAEIKKIETTASDADKCDDDEQFDEKLKTIKEELQAMIGRKCSAPHDHTWGVRAYHNAIVCGVDDATEYDIKNIQDFRLRILYTNPTHKEMVPCSYYLNGDCKFDTDKCHFSHGELIPFGELREYKEPDFSKLKRNCVVLAKMRDKMWHKAKVLCANFVEKECRVRLEQQKKEIDCNFEDLFPIFHDDDDQSSSSDSDSDDKDEMEDFRQAQLVEKCLLTYSADQALGEWEKHTRGIGSKLMQKMGYVFGTGLGSEGEGIVVPISAQILPPGRSLDYCMELREAANGDKDLFNVERNLQREKKRQEVLNAKAYEREKSKTDMFSFLNDNILSSGTNVDTKKSNIQSRQDFKNHSTKNLNVESLKIADDIRKKEKEIQKIKEAMKRQSCGSDIHKRLEGQLLMRDNELKLLKKSETNVAREQLSRKHKDKLCVF